MFFTGREELWAVKGGNILQVLSPSSIRKVEADTSILLKIIFMIIILRCDGMQL